MKLRLNRGIYILVGVILLTACSEKNTSIYTQKLTKIKTSRIVDHLDSLSKTEWSFFYARIATKYSSSTTKVSFKTILKMQKDSIVNATITFAAIPIIHVLLSPDTLKVVNKKDKCYIIETVDFLKKEFDFPFGYKQVEELLLGKPLAWNKSDRFHQIENPDYYILKTNKKRFASKDKEEGDIDLNYYLSPEELEIKKIIINSPEDSTSIILNYSDWVFIDKMKVPQSVEVYIYTPKDSLFIELKYQKVEFGNTKEIVFIIPDQYEHCK